MPHPRHVFEIMRQQPARHVTRADARVTHNVVSYLSVKVRLR
jgi:hypothetical protein